MLLTALQMAYFNTCGMHMLVRMFGWFVQWKFRRIPATSYFVIFVFWELPLSCKRVIMMTQQLCASSGYQNHPVSPFFQWRDGEECEVQVLWV